MHRSRIGVALLDHPAETYDAAAAFWAGAVGRERGRADAPPEEDPYESLGPQAGGLLLELQRTGSGTPPRVHLDIETDDVEAELARVTALGATVTTRHEEWAVLADPGGMPFCVVPVQTGDAFEEHAVTWP
ncbi:VOC family protein [Phycicoccus flavus]|uniref:Glyoxalase/bleomycin resistance/dioxygenase family protein n=1 Tax=Phycicoccus flavus TaxID=2502783 RepID=A0A8T6RBZ8_9MICO|nr:VOC family protein [Phycicoccus flavus]NHA70345.1 glyoxalase/bleomycin resistance/dioxygenase family protein [Phycicoccus flavus]